MPAWQAATAARVRELIREADPDIEETVKYQGRPYFVLEGNVCALQTTKDHLNVFLYDGGLAPDPHGIITDGFANATGRQIKLYEDSALDEAAFVELIRAIASMNRAGGWRRIARS
jgi:hypothetical protein